MGDDIRIELADPQGWILAELGNPRIRRDDVALSYALALNCPERVDWGVVNRAIVGRWSPSALAYVKAKAWKLRAAKAAEAASGG